MADIGIFDGETGENTIVEVPDSVIEEMRQPDPEYAAALAQQEAEAAAKAAAKASAIAKLAALGLTEDEAAALVGQ